MKKTIILSLILLVAMIPAVSAQTCGSQKIFAPFNSSQATDYSGCNNDGTLNGGVTTGTSTPYGDAFSFDGGDYVNFGDNDSFEAQSNFSLHISVNTTQGNGDTAYAISKRASANNNGYGLVITNGGDWHFLYDFGTYYDVATQAETYDDGNMHNITAIKQGSNLSIYADGNLAQSINNAPSGSNTNSANLRISGLGDGTRPFFGSVRNLHLSQEAWNSTEVSNLNYCGEVTCPSSGGGAGNSAPSASFTTSTTDLTVDVDASGSSDSDGSISSYEWDWTDDGTYEGTGETASHTYGSDGTYTVELRVTDDDGATDTVTKDVSVSSGSTGSIIDDFEDGDLSEYGIFGNSDGAEVTTQYAYEGSYSANVTSFGGNYEVIASTSGLDRYYSQGDGNLSVKVRTETPTQENTFAIGQADESSQNWQGALVWEDGAVEIIDGGFNTLDTGTWTDLSEEWAEWKFNWMENGTLNTWVYDSQGNLQAEMSADIGASTDSGILMKVNSPNSEGSVGSVFFDQIQVGSGSDGGSTNTAPSASNFDPVDGTTGVNDTVDGSPVDVNVSASVSDDENSALNVYAYRDGVFQEKKTVSNNTEVEFVFQNLSSGTTYDWNFKVGDDVTNTTTSNRSFTTALSESLSDKFLEGEYRLNETSSPSLDFSVNNRDLTWKNTASLSATSNGYIDSGGTWYDGRAIDFQNGGYLLSDTTGYDITNEATLVAWINVNQAGSNSYNRFVSYDDLYDGDSSGIGFFWDADDDTRGALGYSAMASGDIITGSWVCVASAYDGSNAYYYEMESGESNIELEASGSQSLNLDGNEKLALGADTNGGSNADAKIDEPKIFSSNLSKSELESICNTNSIEETPPPPTPNVSLNSPSDTATVESPVNTSASIEFFDTLDRIELWTNSTGDATDYSISQNSRTTIGTDSGTQDHFSRPVYAETVTGKQLVLYREASGHGVDLGDKWHMRCRNNFSDSWSSPDTYCNGTSIPNMPYDTGLSENDADISVAPNGSVVIDFFRFSSGVTHEGSYQVFAGKDGFDWGNGEEMSSNYVSSQPYNTDQILFGQDHAVVGDNYFKTAYVQPGSYENSLLYKSTDSGDTFELVQNLSSKNGVNTNEAGIAPINNSAFLVLMRSNDGTATWQRIVLENGSSMTPIEDVSDTIIGHIDRPRMIQLSTGDIAMVGKDKSPANSVGFGVYDVESHSWDYYNQFTQSYGDAGYGDIIESSVSQEVGVASYTGNHDAANVEEWKFDLSYDKYGWGKKTEKSSGLGGNNTVSWIESEFSYGSHLWNIKAVQSDGKSSFADQNRTFTVSTPDTTPPTSSDNWTATGFVDQSSATIELTATDSGGSGVEDIYYRVNGGSYTTVAGSSATVTVSNQGNNTLEYYAEDSAGNVEPTNTEYVALSSNEPPIARASFTKDGLTLNIQALASEDPDGSIESYEWDWTRDGTFEGNGQTSSHTYSSAGDYEIELQVTDDDGATDTLNDTISVTEPNSAPTASFTTTTNNLELGVDASGSSDSDGTISELAWDWTNDGNFETVKDESQKPGQFYNVEVISTSNGNKYLLNGTQQKNIDLERGVNHTFNLTSSVQGHPFHISTSAIGGNFNGQITEGVSVTNPYNGNEHAADTGKLYYKPPVDESRDLYYQCGIHSYMGADISLSTHTLTDPTATHTYGSEGTYNVKLRVTDNDGATDTQVKTVSVSSGTDDGGDGGGGGGGTIDTTPPDTTDNWDVQGFLEKTQAAVSLSATDAGVGVDRIEYQINGNGFTSVSGNSASVNIFTEGNNTLEYYAVDNNGNEEQTQTEYVAFKTSSNDGGSGGDGGGDGSQDTVSLQLESPQGDINKDGATEINQVFDTTVDVNNSGTLELQISSESQTGFTAVDGKAIGINSDQSQQFSETFKIDYSNISDSKQVSEEISYRLEWQGDNGYSLASSVQKFRYINNIGGTGNNATGLFSGSVPSGLGVYLLLVLLLGVLALPLIIKVRLND